MVQKGVGEGTATRKRRDPRMKVQDVGIAEASGLTLGPDGYPHPMETTAFGELRVTERTSAAVLEDVLLELQRLRLGMVLAGYCEDIEQID